LLEFLEKEREKSEEERLEEYSGIMEFKRLEENYGIIKGFAYKRKNDRLILIFRGGILLPINLEAEDSFWKNLKVGESKYVGIAFDTESKTLSEMFRDFFKRSFTEGKLQDFIPFK